MIIVGHLNQTRMNSYKKIVLIAMVFVHKTFFSTHLWHSFLENNLPITYELTHRFDQSHKVKVPFHEWLLKKTSELCHTVQNMYLC